MNILLAGAAGFIGFHTARALLARGHHIVGIDELNAYYDPRLKEARLAELAGEKGFRFVKGDISVPGMLGSAAKGEKFDAILNLAAQAGVRYALKDPVAYTRSNLVGHHNVLEFARHHGGLQHLVYASSSSVYGNDTVAPFSEDARADKPVSYYGATKRAGELLSYSYSDLFGLKQTGLRFFTVYGPFGRPDMAYWSFTDLVLQGKPIPVFGGGKLRRDFTYIDDIVAAVVRILETPYPQSEGAPHRVYNLGNSHPEEVLDLIAVIEQATGKKAIIHHTDGPPGDVRETYADVTRAARDFGFAPTVKLSEGIPRFVDWFRHYQTR
ncbi:MAG TPA: NAD-dependent epimerase/dehydratase family protein [Asticcacaulis sp.]|nr:NAD-dependent epimerase/dehydratase family protein [Asticcacaulis sp.]